MKPLSKKHYMWTVNSAAFVLVLAAIVSDRYPEWRTALLGVSTVATGAGIWVYFHHRFDVLAGRATDDELDAATASDKDHV